MASPASMSSTSSSSSSSPSAFRPSGSTRKRGSEVLGPSQQERRVRKCLVPDVAQKHFVSVQTDLTLNSVGHNTIVISNLLSQDMRFKLQETSRKYVKLGNFIYSVTINSMLKGRQILTNEVQMKQMVKSYGIRSDGLCVVSQLSSSCQRQIKNFSHAVFQIKMRGDLLREEGENGKAHIDVNELRKLFHDHFDDQYFKVGQKLIVIFPGVGHLTAKLVGYRSESSTEEGDVPNEHLGGFGRLNKETFLDFKTDDLQLALTDDRHGTVISRLMFQIKRTCTTATRVLDKFSKSTLHANSWKDGMTVTPILIPSSEFFKEFRKQTGERPLIIGQEINVVIGTHQFFLEFTKAVLDLEKSTRAALDREPYESQYVKVFRVGGKDLFIDASEHIILTTDVRNARPANTARFVLEDRSGTTLLEENERLWVSVEELFEKIRSSMPPLPKKGRFLIETTKGNFLVKLERAYDDQVEKDNLKRNQELWVLGPNTAITLRASPRLGVTLVDTVQAKTIVSAKVKVEPVALSTEQEQEAVTLMEGELRELYLECLPSRLFDKQSITITTQRGQELKLTLEEIVYPDKIEPCFEHVYTLTPDSKLSFYADRDSHLCIKKPAELSNEFDIKSRLLEMGMGGLPEECYTFIREVNNSRGAYKKLYSDLGIKPSRGAIFYGPPGTGKTETARLIGQLFGVPEDNFIKITASSILKKYVGSSEKAIRSLFKKARDAQEKDGAESEKFVLFFDEMDGVFYDRSLAVRGYEISILNTLLSELDGIAGKDGKSLDNIIVIGSTNRIDRIDSALKRPGRMGTLVEFRIPDKEGRKEIIRIHTKRLQENNLFVEPYEDVVEHLASLTIGKAGAFISGLVQKALGIYTSRLSRDEIPAGQALTSATHKLTREDFYRAYCEIRNDKVKCSSCTSGSHALVPSAETMVERLKSLGLAGVDGDVVRSLEQIYATRLRYRDSIQDGITQTPRGMFIYGPTGTGKSALVDALPGALGLDNDHFYRYQASELWQSGGHTLREEIKLSFESIQQAAKDLGPDSPLFVVVIEDIDRLYPHLKGSVQTLNNFLEELDALFNKHHCSIHAGAHKKANNLLVVATMTTDRRLEESTHYNNNEVIHVEMKLPLLKRRQEIIDFYLQPLVEKKWLAKDVNAATLVDLTSGYNVAAIKSMISNVVSERVVFAHQMNVSEQHLDEYVANNPLSLDHFKEAIKAVSASTGVAHGSLYS